MMAGALRSRRTTVASARAPDAGSNEQSGQERDPVRDVPRHDLDAEEGGAERPDLAVREVDDAVGAVDQHQADGQQPVGEADDQAEQQHRPRRLPVAAAGVAGVHGCGRTWSQQPDDARRRRVRAAAFAENDGTAAGSFKTGCTIAGAGVHGSAFDAPSRNTARSRSSRCSSSWAGPSKRISPFSMK